LRIAIVVVAALLAAVAFAAWRTAEPPELSADVLRTLAEPGDAEAGKLVFYEGGCESCHMSAGQDDPLKLGGGRELKSPFGSFYPPNISSDTADGLGAWSVEDFGGALLAGRTPRGQPYYPALPYPSYTHMTPKDVRDLFAFLKTLPAIAGRPPPHALAFPFNVRLGVGLWMRLYFRPGPLPEVAGQDPQWRRGRYLVEGPGHCAECHSPRTWLGGIEAARRFHGGPAPDGKGKTPDITAAGLKDWTNADIEEALNSGFTPTGDSLGGAMAAVVRNTAQLPAADRAAIAVYLKSLN
jgi:mono/diheme cytochrome c family protein